ncbi:methyltransferase-like protein 25B isoform X2 [Amblyomma americanum]
METAEYLLSCARFLAEFSWMYEARMTDLLITGTLDRIPVEWVNHLDKLTDEELAKVPFGLIMSSWPADLQAFVSRAMELGVARFLEPPAKPVVGKASFPPTLRRGLTPKKCMELEWVTALVADVCNGAQCGKVLDVGAGVGHLARILHHRFGLTVLGVDSDASHLSKAQELLRHSGCTRNVHHYTLQVDDSEATVEKVRTLLADRPDPVSCTCGKEHKFSEQLIANDQYVLVSLHACGQLSPRLVRLFHSLPEVKALICIGCCYHKATTLNGYFPLSDELASLGDQWLNTSARYQGLRLACQELRHSWEPGREPQHLLYRAMLEMACQMYDLPWRKSRRHMARQSQLSSWLAYRDHIMHDVDCSTRKEHDAWCSILDQLHTTHEGQLPKLLRQLLQPCWEGLVLGDRARWSGARLMAAFPSAGPSPRNVALLLVHPLPQTR